MGLFSKKKTEKPEEKQVEKQPDRQAEKKPYIRGAGGTIVTKSILNGTSKLKWLFRQEAGEASGPDCL